MDLKKKVGPLPLWGWAAVGGVIGLYLYEKNKGTSSAAAAPAATDSGTVAPDTSGLGGGGLPAGTTDPGLPVAGAGSANQVDLTPLQDTLANLSAQISDLASGGQAAVGANLGGGSGPSGTVSSPPASVTAHPNVKVLKTPPLPVGTAVHTVGGALAKISTGSNSHTLPAVAPSSHKPPAKPKKPTTHQAPHGGTF